MRWGSAALPERMERVAIVGQAARDREVLIALAETGAVELAGGAGDGAAATAALRRTEAAARGSTGGEAPAPLPRLSREAPDLDRLVAAGDRDLLAGEVEIARRRDAAVRHGRFALLVGWTPRTRLEDVSARLAEVGASVVRLRRPRGVDPPTLLHPAGPARAFRPLVATYGAVPYANVDPTAFAAVTFLLMFGVMFGDVGDGLLLVAAALALRGNHHARVADLRWMWPFLLGAGASATVFGLLYGELFGPTGIVPALWLDPLDRPITLLLVTAGVGVVFLFASGALGAVNRYREAGLAAALVAPSGIAGIALLGSLTLAAGAAYRAAAPLAAAAGVLGVLALAAMAIGFYDAAGGGVASAGEALVEVANSIVRVVANVVSFARLAAFGLVHAAIGAVVVKGAAALAGSPVGWLAAAVLLLAGSAAAFALGALIAAVQGLRLEYYELFSRVFSGEGHPFSPWSFPVTSTEERP